jgi:beta-galactosidase
MAEHFAGTPNVIGWQTDNEFGHPVCYCPSCQSEFQQWLQRKYGTLEELNRAWGTHFWGHRYGHWTEIPIPVDGGGSNPGAGLDWNRFFSWLNVRFQADQVKILRKCAPKHFVTHNFMGLFSDLNYYDLARDLDLVTWDNYPVWGKRDVHYGAAAAADVMRGLKKKTWSGRWGSGARCRPGLPWRRTARRAPREKEAAVGPPASTGGAGRFTATN